MATDDDSNLKIGIGLDTSKLPGEARQAERTIKEAVEGATDAVEAQGTAAEQTGQAHTEAAHAATAGQQQTAQAVEDTTAAVEEQQAATQKVATATADGINKTTTTARSSIQQVSKDGTKAVGELSGSIGKGTQAVGGFTSALNLANGVMGVLSKTFAVIGLINQVATSLKLIADWYADISKKAEDAGRKVRATWAAQREEARRLRDQNAALDALKAQEEAHDRILEKMRAEHAFQASMRAMEARRTGNVDEMNKATLDGMLARGEITEGEHIDRTRAIDDAARERRQAEELAGPMSELTQALTIQGQKQEELAAANAAMSELMARGKAVGLVDKQGHDTNSMEDFAAEWARLNQFINKHGGDTGRWARNLLKGNISLRDSYAKKIYDAAEALHLSTTREVDGEQVRIPVTEMATMVQDAWIEAVGNMDEEILAARGDKLNADVAVRRKSEEVEAKKKVHDSEDAKVEEGYKQQDLTLAWSANRAATEANTEAQRAATEAEREEQREELTQRQDAAADAAEDARSTYSTNWAMEQERATAEQAPAMAAINRLLTRGEKEPRALEQLQALLSGQEVTLTDDEARRYGQDLQLAKNGGLTGEQQAGISTVVNLLLAAMKAEADAKALGQEVDAFNQDDATRARAEQDAEVARLRAEADEARARADEANARLQRYETAGAAPAAPAPAPGAAPAVPQPATMPPVDDALRAAGDVVAQHNDLATAVMGAMGQFNATTATAVAAIGQQRGQLAKLTTESRNMQQQLANLARANV